MFYFFWLAKQKKEIFIPFYNPCQLNLGSGISEIIIIYQIILTQSEMCLMELQNK